MTAPSNKANLFEQVVTVTLVLLFAVCGWGPFLFKALDLPFLQAPMLFVSLALAVFALGLTYDAAERLSKGRGIYAAAIFCSLPATGIIATDPGSLALSGGMLLVAVSFWLISRAHGDNRPYFLAMLSVVLLIGGYFYGLFPGNLSLIAAIWITARHSKSLRLAFWGLIAAFLTGVMAHYLLKIGLPTLASVSSSDKFYLGDLILPWLPWAFLLIPAIGYSFKRPPIFASWWRESSALILLMIAVAWFTRSSMSAVAAMTAPLLAILIGDVAYESFSFKQFKRFGSFAFASHLAALALIVLPLLSAFRSGISPIIDAYSAAAALFIAAALVTTTLLCLPRWSFPFLFGAGMLFGRILDARDPIIAEIPYERISLEPDVYFFMLAGAVVLAVVFYYMLRRMVFSPTERDAEFRFGGADFRRFDLGNSSKSPVMQNIRDSYSFVVFGDVTGAESPFSTRRGGFFVFRAFVQILRQINPTFAISLGDLASQATPGAYARLRRLLRRLSVPLMATPGNHDVFFRDQYNARGFHHLFGNDNAAFRLGDVRLILLNNAWGSMDDRQFDWLEKLFQEDRPPFTLVFCHKPPFDLRPDSSYAMEDRPHAERLHRLFRDHHVTAIFSGHIHALLAENKDGVTYVVSGGGGSKLVETDAQHHFLKVDVRPRELIVRALPILSARQPLADAPLLELKFSPRA